MQRRLRSLAVVSDLQRLGELGLDPAASADAQQAFALDLYRANALAGQFDHLPLFVDPAKLSVDVGANAGQYALKLACLCPSVLVIEPAPALAWLARLLPRTCVFRGVAAGAEGGHGRAAHPPARGTAAERAGHADRRRRAIHDSRGARADA